VLPTFWIAPVVVLTSVVVPASVELLAVAVVVPVVVVAFVVVPIVPAPAVVVGTSRLDPVEPNCVKLPSALGVKPVLIPG
jgi:hypothetical protein